jgi:hypothetical protein
MTPTFQEAMKKIEAGIILACPVCFIVGKLTKNDSGCIARSVVIT